MLPRATENVMAGRIWPAGRYLLTPGLINSRVQYESFAWGRAALCQLQPILVVLNRDVRRSNCDS